MVFRLALLLIFIPGVVSPLWSQRSRAQTKASRILFNDFQGEKLRFYMTSQFMSGVDFEFGNLGAVDFDTETVQGTDGIIHRFDDGFIQVDPAGSEVTSTFGFDFDNTTIDNEGFVETATLTRFSSESTGASESFSDSNNFGVEMGMQYFAYEKPNFRVGLAGAFGVNDIEATSSGSVEGNLFKQTATLLLQNAQIAAIPDQNFTGGNAGPAIDLNNDLIFDPGSREPVRQNVAGEGVVNVPSQVNGSYRLEGITTGLRVGAITEFNYKKLWFQAGVGYSSIYTYSEFSVRQTLENPQLSRNIEMSGANEENRWFHGPYAEVRGGFQISPNTRIFIGGIFINLSNTFDQNVDGVTSQIKLDNPMIIEIGFNFDF